MDTKAFTSVTANINPDLGLCGVQGCSWGKQLHVDVNSDLSSAQIQEIKDTVDKERLVILPNQVLISHFSLSGN